MLLACRPASQIRHLIRHYYQVTASLAAQVSLQPVPARSPQIIEFMFGTPYEVHRLDINTKAHVRPIALVGARTSRSAELILSGNVDAFTMVFQPGGFSALFGIPAIELTNLDFDAEDVIGRRIDELHQRLASVSEFADRIRIADDWMTALRPACKSESAVVRSAMAVIRSGGVAGISQLAEQTGLGIRQFERRFSREIGVSPKLYARIVRFEAALQHRASAARTSWTAIAHALGYYDQMHMVHDFTLLSGEAPEVIARQLDMFVQPEVLSTGPIEERRGRNSDPVRKESRV